MSAAFSADDVRAAQVYMTYKSAGVIPGARDLQAAYFQGQEVLQVAVLRYAPSSKDAASSPKVSPVVTRNYRGKRWYYWLLDRATFNSIRGKERKGK